jgi:hypothetical protein
LKQLRWAASLSRRHHALSSVAVAAASRPEDGKIIAATTS